MLFLFNLAFFKASKSSLAWKLLLVKGDEDTNKKPFDKATDLYFLKSFGLTNFLTIGQYLQPTIKHHKVEKFVHPDEFDKYKKVALSKGFLLVSSSPFTRSSFHASEDFEILKKIRKNQLKS